MEKIRSVESEGIKINYYVVDPSETTCEYGIYVSSDIDDWKVESLSDDYEFIIELINQMADSCTKPEFVQDICEDAIFERAFKKYTGR